jgi:hypothetical protein
MKRKQIRQVANSVKTFGFKVPVLIDRDDKVIAGALPVACLPRARRHRGADPAPLAGVDGWETNWHLEVIAAKLTAVREGKIRRLIDWYDHTSIAGKTTSATAPLSASCSGCTKTT